MATRGFAFIRAINTGNRRLTNDAVIAPFLALGLDDVEAYQAAGNVAFRTGEESASLASKLAAALAEAYGFDAPIFLRSADELRALVEAVPFTQEQLDATDGRVQVAFLRGVPTADQTAAVEALTPSEDAVAFVGPHLFWLPKAGISTSDLPVGKVEDALGPMTIRTLGTVERLLKKFPD